MSWSPHVMERVEDEPFGVRRQSFLKQGDLVEAFT